MYECERNLILNPGDDMMSGLGNSSFAPFLRFFSCGASSLPLEVTPSSALTKSQKSSQNTRIARDLGLSLQVSRCFRAFYLAKQCHLRLSKILVLLAKNHKTKLKIPAFLSGHLALSDKSAIDTHYFGDRFHTLSPRASCQSPDLSSQILECLDGNSSLGNHSQDLGSLEAVTTAKVAPTPKLPKNLQSNTANTRIVCGEIQESKTNSESSLSDSRSLLESSLKDSIVSKANLESSTLVSQTLSESTPSVIASHSFARAKQSTEKANAMDSKLDSKKLDCHDFDKSKSHNDDSLESHTDFKTISDSNPQNSQIASESSLKVSYCVSESLSKYYKPISKSTLLDSQSISKHTSKAYRHILAFYLYFTHKRGYLC